MARRRRIDPLAQRVVLSMAGCRVGIGAATFLATGPAMRAAGLGDANATGRAVGKVAGARDVALGLLTLAVREDREMLRTVALAAALLDAADAAAFTFAAAEPETRRGGAIGVLAGGGAALLGFWAWRRLA
ncbi:MAG TPA: hypothetical protein VGI73_04145 [Solirubrobacterales bacterium]